MRNRIRHLIVPLACFIGVLCSGCSGQNPTQLKPEDLMFSFQCRAEVTSGIQKFTCILAHSAPGMGSVQVTSGESAGLTYYWSGQNFSISYAGVTAESEDCVLPKSSFAYLLQSVMDHAEKDGTLAKTHGNDFSGVGDGYDFTLTADGTGQIRNITIPKYEVSANLSDFTEIGVS